ncbi:MAG TPA: glycosyltransferase family 4 protein [Chloroflexia bacterium]|nr:glycosyltransferase family 4 protein [Chloroflexia bacterium]
MRVLHVIQRYWPFPGGSEGYFQELSEALVARGHAVTVFTTDAWDLEYFWAAGKRRVTRPAGETYNGVRIRRFPVRRPPLPPIYFRILRRLMADTSDLGGRLKVDTGPLLRIGGRCSPWVPAMQAALRAIPPGTYDVVHTTNITLEAPILGAAAYARRAGVPMLLTPFVHLGEAGDRRIVRYYTMRHQVALLRQATRVIVQTGLEATVLREHGVATERLVHAAVGVHPDQVLGGDGSRFRRRHGLAADTPLVLFVGALAADKGALTLLEASRRLWAAGVDMRLVLIGATALADFQSAFTRLPVDEQARVLLLGFVDDAGKRDAFAACTVFAMPSRTDTFGIVYLEAWLYGKPVIGARAGGVPDVIAGGTDGYLVRFGDAAAVADHIAALIADPVLAARLGEAGRAKVMREHTWADKLDRLVAVYEDVTAHG